MNLDSKLELLSLETVQTFVKYVAYFLKENLGLSLLIKLILSKRLFFLVKQTMDSAGHLLWFLFVFVTLLFIPSIDH